MYIPTNKEHQNIIRKILCAEDDIYKKIICLLSLGIQFKNFIETTPIKRIKQLKVLPSTLFKINDWLSNLILCISETRTAVSSLLLSVKINWYCAVMGFARNNKPPIMNFVNSFILASY